MSFRRLTLMLAGAAVAIILFTGTACAQTQKPQQPSHGWIVADALGFGALGLVVGGLAGGVVTAGSDCGFGPCEGAALMALSGALIGAAGGAALGVNARRAAAQGNPITPRHQGAMKAGAILGGATFGALISSAMINGEGSGTPIGSDETAFFSLTGGGLVMGFLFVATHRRELDRITIAPSAGRKGYGLMARMSF